ncbi:MAG: enolase C-terminal domain-like protein [Chlamydiota bacterium]
MGLYSCSHPLDYSWVKSLDLQYTRYSRSLHPPLFGIKKREGCVVSYAKTSATKEVEIAPLPGRSQETLEEAIEDFQQGMGRFPSSRFALESLTLPHYPKEEIPFSFLLTGSVETMRDDARLSTTTYMKVKIGHFSWKEAVFCLKTLKSLFPEKHWALDGNRGWTFEEFSAFTRSFDPSDFLYIEEPVSSLLALRRVAQTTPFRLALDESLYETSAKELLGFPSISTLVVKPTLYGGLTDLIALQKHARDKEIVLSSSVESKVGLKNIEKLRQALQLKTPLGVGTNRFFF